LNVPVLNISSKVWPWVTNSLWVIHRIHTQLQLRLIWLPAFVANLDRNLFGLDYKILKVFEFYPNATTITFGYRLFTSGKPVCHD
jgi:hypothetical protein